MKYKAKRGVPLKREDAQIIGERLERLMQSGPITNEMVVDDARPEASPIHPYFEWDDETAAEKYRLQQAGYYLRCIEVEVETSEEPVRAFHVVTVDEGIRGYVPLDTVVSHVELLEQIIAQAFHSLQSWRRQYKQYRELLPALASVEQALAALEEMVA